MTSCPSSNDQTQGVSNSDIKITKELQQSNPSAIIELFQLDLIPNIHYDPKQLNLLGISTSYYFHDGTNNNNFGSIKWTKANGSNELVEYVSLPVKAEGFKFGRGQLPRPTLTFSNALGAFTTILTAVNAFNTFSDSFSSEGLINNDLTGAKVTRKRTLEKFLPISNYPTGIVPSYNAFDSTYPEFPQEIYFIDRKSEENREVVQFELAANFDLANIKCPRRLISRDHFPSAGVFKG